MKSVAAKTATTASAAAGSHSRTRADLAAGPAAGISAKVPTAARNAKPAAIR